MKHAYLCFAIMTNHRKPKDSGCGQWSVTQIYICVCVQVHYVLNKAPPGWTGAEGFITSDLIKKHFPPPGEGVKILRCGPLPMNKAMKAHLDALGYTPEMQFEF